MLALKSQPHRRSRVIPRPHCGWWMCKGGNKTGSHPRSWLLEWQLYHGLVAIQVLLCIVRWTHHRVNHWLTKDHFVSPFLRVVNVEEQEQYHVRLKAALPPQISKIRIEDEMVEYKEGVKVGRVDSLKNWNEIYGKETFKFKNWSIRKQKPIENVAEYLNKRRTYRKHLCKNGNQRRRKSNNGRKDVIKVPGENIKKKV